MTSKIYNPLLQVRPICELPKETNLREFTLEMKVLNDWLVQHGYRITLDISGKVYVEKLCYDWGQDFWEKIDPNVAWTQICANVLNVVPDTQDKFIESPKAVLAVNVYKLISDVVEREVRYGYNRAYKHTDTPTEEQMCMEIETAVMNGLCEAINFDRSGMAK